MSRDDEVENLGVDTEFHDDVYEQDETAFVPVKQSMNESSQFNEVFEIEAEGGVKQASEVDSDYENDLRNVRYGEKGPNGQREAPVFNVNV